MLSLTGTIGAFVGTGAPATYTPGMYVKSASQVVVREDGVIQALGTDYTLVGVDSASGVSVQGTFANGSKVIIERVTPITQDIDVRDNQTLLETVVETGLDKRTMVEQELSERIFRCFRVPAGETLTELPADTLRHDTIVGFGAAGQGMLYSTSALAALVAADINLLLPSVVKGDPGANVMAVGLFSAGAGMNIPLGTDVIRTSGHSVKGVGIADYYNDDATVDAAFVLANPRTSFISANGRGFRLQRLTVDFTFFGARFDSVTDDTNALVAALAYVNTYSGGVLQAPIGTAVHSAKLPVFAKTTIRGQGKYVTFFASAHVGGGGANAGQSLANGSAFVSTFPINSSTVAAIGYEDFCAINTNPANIGAAIYDTGGTFIHAINVRLMGFSRGAVLDQSELVDFLMCAFESQLAGGAGLWLVNGSDLTPGALGVFTNRVSVKLSQFNQGAFSYCILDYGGYLHTYEDNNYNGGIAQVYAASVEGLILRGGQWESSAGPCVVLDYRRLDLTGLGPSQGVSILGGFMVPPAGQAAIQIVSAGSLEVGGGLQFSTTVAAIQGCINTAWLSIGAAFQRGTGTLRDGDGTKTFDMFAGQGLIAKDPAVAVIGPHVQMSYEAGDFGLIESIHTGLSWKPLYLQASDLRLRFNSIDVLKIGNGFADIIGEGRVNGVKVLGPRGAALPADATDLASCMALANATKARLSAAAGGNGTVP